MNDTTNNGGPAFPIPLQPGQGWQGMAQCDGMTLRQYAAIRLRVPNSGTDWLDAMIVEAKRDELAAKAMQGLIASPTDPKSFDAIGVFAYNCADAMLKARGQA